MTIRIIQLTDCHLFADRQQTLRDIATWPRFLSVLDHIRKNNNLFDLMILSGDTAHDEVLATYDMVASELENWKDRVRVIPGNHDDRISIRTKFPPSTGTVPGRVTFRVVLGNWQIIGLDSHRPRELPGSLGAEQLAWLRSAMNESPDRHTVLVLHHPPVAMQSPWLDKIGLLDADELVQIAREFPAIRLILTGHVHQESSHSLGTAIVLTSPAVGPPFRPRTESLEILSAPPCYRIVDLEDDGRWNSQTIPVS